MKNLRRTFTVLFAAAFSMQVLAQREDKLINQDWSFDGQDFSPYACGCDGE